MSAPQEIVSIPAAFEALAKKHPNKAAVIYLGTRFSYGRIKELSDRFAAGLQSMGLGDGTRIMVYLPNSVHWVVAWLGILKAGSVAVPITPIYTSRDVEYIAGDTGCKAVVCADRNYGHVVRAMDNAPIEQVVVCGLDDLLPWVKRAFGYLADVVPKGRVGNKEHTVRLSKLLRSGAAGPSAVELDPDQTAEFLYTGGTTKHPKGVPISHHLLLKCCREQLAIPSHLFDPADNVLLGSAPMFHVLGQTCGLGTLFTYGGTIVTQPRVNLDAMLDAVSREGVTTLIGVPTLLRMILEHDRLDQYDLSSIKYVFSGGDVLPQELANRWQEKFGRPIYIGYGSTETVGGVAMCPTDRENPVGTMGQVVGSKEVLVAELDGATLVEVGEPGELLVHSEPMVSAYLNKPEETDESFVELDGKLFYRTGDIVTMDADQFLFFVDRTADTIKHKGYRVSASEVECILQDHPAVISACVVGVPDEKVGDRVKAYVILKKDVKGITGYDLIAFCRKNLASYKVPQYIEFRDMLPKSKVGKLLRREIRSEEKSRLE